MPSLNRKAGSLSSEWGERATAALEETFTSMGNEHFKMQYAARFKKKRAEGYVERIKTARPCREKKQNKNDKSSMQMRDSTNLVYQI